MAKKITRGLRQFSESKRVAFFCCLVFGLVLPPVVYCQQEDTPLTLSIKADQEAYIIKDKITITFKFKNISGKEIQFIPYPKGYIYKKNWISIYDVSNKPMPNHAFAKPQIKPFTKADLVSLSPQAEYSYDLDAVLKNKLPSLKYKGLYLDFGDSAILLAANWGRYKLKSELNFPFGSYLDGQQIYDRGLWTGALVSNETEIEILNAKKNPVLRGI